MQKELNSIIDKIKYLIESDINFGIDEYYLKLNSNNSFVEKNNGAEKKLDMLNELKEEALKCRKCQLYKSRTHLVFGEGNPNAELLFIGEAPGRQEDLEGRPFVGMAGKLLTKIINAMGFKREDIYIANILKDRPPNNRNPESDEIAACKNYLIRQIGIITPRVICTLGKFASQILLETETPISKLRGRFFNYQNIKLMPTYHPAYLLRNPRDKKLVWEDMKKIIKELKIDKR